MKYPLPQKNNTGQTTTILVTALHCFDRTLYKENYQWHGRQCAIIIRIKPAYEGEPVHFTYVLKKIVGFGELAPDFFEPGFDTTVIHFPPGVAQ